MSFDHFDEEGRAHLADVSGQEPTIREARAEAFVELGPELLAEILDQQRARGDILGVARLAGISAVKKTPELVPLAHPLAIHHAAVEFELDHTAGLVRSICAVRAFDRAGVEMEALTGATVAALTIYDMCKAHDPSLSIGPVRLLARSEGRGGGDPRRHEGRA